MQVYDSNLLQIYTYLTLTCTLQQEFTSNYQSFLRLRFVTLSCSIYGYIGLDSLNCKQMNVKILRRSSSDKACIFPS